MREIKFRCWDKKRKTFELRGIGTTFPHDVYSGNGKIHQTLTITGRDDDWVWQQYIGQKDVNGQEIYEGDICRQYWQGHEIIAPMIWNQDKLQFGLDAEVDFDTEGSHLEISVSRNTGPEVIGNIYETPELLK